MSIDNLSLFLDIIILLGLATTIYFALRLSQSLNNFRKQRHDFEKIMRHLNDNIEKAHRSLADLKGFSGSFDQDVQDSLREAKDLLDELKMINHSGNNLADRLENLASQSSYINEANATQGAVHDLSQERAALQQATADADYDQQLYNTISAMESRSSDEGFSIQDREYGESGTSYTETGRSQAEQDLLDALRRKQGAV